MSRFRIVLEIARWEFFRWFKLRDQIITLLIAVTMSIAFGWGQMFLGRNSSDQVNLVVLNEDILPERVQMGSRITLNPPVGRSEHELREAVARKELDGLLILKSLDEGELVVHKDPLWKNELQQYLNLERRRVKIEQMKVSGAQITDALSPFNITMKYPETAMKQATLAERISAVILIGLMFIGVFYSAGNQFVAITGEKQLRVTEQIISAVSPQQWIDGKILGIGVFSLVRTIGFAVSVFAFVLTLNLFGWQLQIPIEFTNPAMLLVLVVLSIGGFLFWNAFCAALAATINDPNTSSKTAFVFAPILPSIGFAFAALKNPDSLLMQILTLLPITSPAVLSARLVLTDVAVWEVVLAVVLLMVAIALLRRAAGKIFHLGILMYGKEPTVKEMVRWLRKT